MKKLPKYLSKKISNKEKGQKGEEKVKSTINSGALFFDKADLKMDDYLIEVKTVGKNNQGVAKQSFRITTKLVEKIMDEAYSIKKDPLICIVFPKYTLHIQVHTHLRKRKNE